MSDNPYFVKKPDWLTDEQLESALDNLHDALSTAVDFSIPPDCGNLIRRGDMHQSILSAIYERTAVEIFGSNDPSL